MVEQRFFAAENIDKTFAFLQTDEVAPEKPSFSTNFNGTEGVYVEITFKKPNGNPITEDVDVIDVEVEACVHHLTTGRLVV